MTQPSALHAWPLTIAAAAIAAGKITARALAEAQLARIAATESIIEAWTTLDAGAVLADADRCDAAATRGPLHGIGVGVKDIVAARGDFRPGWARRHSRGIAPERMPRASRASRRQVDTCSARP